MKRTLRISLLLMFCFVLGAQEILTPKAPDTPRINGAKVYGNYPGSDFLYRIPATGLRPMTFEAEGLPKGLVLDEQTGIITGKVKKEGEYHVKLTAKNSLGSYERDFKIVIGDKLALTPPLGWNSWNCFERKVTQEQVKAMADALVSSGLADYGWSYINIDDSWQGLRDPETKVLGTNYKFPDMKALVDHIHSLGLKAGIYSGPWIQTYGGYLGEGCDNPDGIYWWIEKGWHRECTRFRDPNKKMRHIENWKHGKYSFAEIDARQWAEWGFDYLKYDWNVVDWYHLEKMYAALKATGRLIVYSISNTAPYGVAPKLVEMAHCWRTTVDIVDTWESVSSIGFGGQDGWAAYRRPGNWPDADMLVVGKVGWEKDLRDTRLTPDEQYTHISLWALMASPLLIGCDLTKMDDFTLGLLTNSEVLDINQDSYGYQASRHISTDEEVVYVKPLDDNSIAVGVFNLTTEPRKIGFRPIDLGIIDEQIVRDVWRQKDLGTVTFKEHYEVEVAPHGVVLLRLYPGITKTQPLGYTRR